MKTKLPKRRRRFYCHRCKRYIIRMSDSDVKKSICEKTGYLVYMKWKPYREYQKQVMEAAK